MTSPLNEDALRALVRDVIGRIESRAGQGQNPGSDAPQSVRLLPSHHQYSLPPSDGPCFIEPGVRCTHCGYCQVHGY